MKFSSHTQRGEINYRIAEPRKVFKNTFFEKDIRQLYTLFTQIFEIFFFFFRFSTLRNAKILLFTFEFSEISQVIRVVENAERVILLERLPECANSALERLLITQENNPQVEVGAAISSIKLTVLGNWFLRQLQLADVKIKTELKNFFETSSSRENRDREPSGAFLRKTIDESCYLFFFSHRSCCI